MSFFESKMVQDELKSINDLQEIVYAGIFKFPAMDRSEKLNHIKMLEELLEKQKVLYMRLSLSDDPDAKLMKERIQESAALMGITKGDDIASHLNGMSEVLEKFKQTLDISESDD